MAKEAEDDSSEGDSDESDFEEEDLENCGLNYNLSLLFQFGELGGFDLLDSSSLQNER